MLTSDRHCSVQKGENKDFLRGAVELSAAKNTSVRLYEPIIIVNIFLEQKIHTIVPFVFPMQDTKLATPTQSHSINYKSCIKYSILPFQTNDAQFCSWLQPK